MARRHRANRKGVVGVVLSSGSGSHGGRCEGATFGRVWDIALRRCNAASRLASSFSPSRESGSLPSQDL